MKTYDITAPTPQGPASRDQQAFLQGIEFHEAAVRSSESQPDEGGAPVVALRAMIVCFAFAIELYLKSLQKKTRGHDLKGLFSTLNSPTRKKIEEAYKVRTGRDQRTLEDDLEKMSSAFADWRYVFEGDGQQIHTNILVAFAKSTLEVAKTINPSWIEDLRIERHVSRVLAANSEQSMTVKNLGGGTFVHLTDGTGVLSKNAKS